MPAAGATPVGAENHGNSRNRPEVVNDGSSGRNPEGAESEIRGKTALQGNDMETFLKLLKETVSEGIAPLTKRIERIEQGQGTNGGDTRRRELEKQKAAHQRAIDDMNRELEESGDNWGTPTNQPPLSPFQNPMYSYYGNPNESSQFVNKSNGLSPQRGITQYGQQQRPQFQLQWHNPQNQFRGPGQAGGNRFRAENLPKFRHGADLDVWILEMDHYVRLWSEQVVCPMIFSYCFPEGDVTRSWYTGLGEVWQQSITEDDGCWKRFQRAMKSKWARSTGEKMVIAESRAKMQNESFVEYGFKKLELCRAAYPDFNEEALIEKVKERIGDEARRYCRERNSTDRFMDELVEYDRTCTPFLNRNRSNSVWENRQNNQRNDRYNQQSERVVRDQKVSSWSQPIPTMKGARETKPAISGRNPDERRATIRDRIHPESGKPTKSFTDRKGNIVFLERACDHCTKNGLGQKWHFRFECPNDSKIATFAADIEDDPDGLAGISETPFTTSPTSHSFSKSASKYITPFVTECFDNGLETEDEFEGND